MPYPPLLEQSCEICRYSEQDVPTMARCRRTAPSPLPIDNEILARWPLVLPTDWCGEWAPGEEGQ